MDLPSKENDLTIGTCKICGGTHTGRIITGSDYAKIDYKGIAKIGDLVKSDCNHLGKIVTGSDYNFIDGVPVAYPNDRFDGDYSGRILAE